MNIYIPWHKKSFHISDKGKVIYKYYFQTYQLKTDNWVTNQEVHILEYTKTIHPPLYTFKGCKSAYYNIVWYLNEV